MIVAIDGAATDVSVAIGGDGGEVVAEEAWTATGRQSAELLPRLLEVAGGSGRQLSSLTAVAVGLGPGSFTGLRVALALGKGLAVALDRPIVGVPSLEAWLEADPDAVAAVARAGAREAYLLRRGEIVLEIVEAAEVASIDGVVVTPGEVAAAFEVPDARPPRGAGAIARRAAERLRTEPRGDEPATLEPIYLRAPRGVPAGQGAQPTWP